MITSLQNRAVKEISALLGKKKERDRRGLFVVEGVKLFGEAPPGGSHRYICRRVRRCS